MPEGLAAGIGRAIERAIELGADVRGTTSPNPPVGAVVLGPNGEVVGEGATQPAGSDHAEVVALRAAGEAAAGSTVVVTLEPCNHTGRTGPCAQALIDAQVARVIYLHADPSGAAGGAEALRQHGIEVEKQDVPAALRTRDAVVPWLTAVRLGRPHVTVKFAQTLDGYTAAADGTSQWITGTAAREYAHRDRAHRDAIVVGTGTALADNPSLTARRADGSLYEHQPRRVVIGKRDLRAAGPASTNLRELGYTQYGDLEEAMEEMYDDEIRDVLVEGGAGLASALFYGGYVDAINAYISPMLLGEGLGILAHPLADTLADAPRFHHLGTRQLGEDVLVEYVTSDAALESMKL
ncbi:bifunctional diaminohydroxyphosphoribosylaminopyrimidine deaminase/5-amino-6-(5-phosphoribosylamino)uracil reductase RibD [Corynebacterium sp. HMSC04H06]|uniref:bifunctional diaminohydroxyphosphoribosylaminopyrimidine deaminase/5-amino-6-(5-phosphoribosylamino)uracil reductase RibD n=1 Tax=Corynebacterium sp. HMSC04H06 TaxID=1581050 RepID=UPI0008A388D5|nr:bifunctional diaminohydroxyphosphoribosylaminopyrimidine deaminase/5-amino-6-(5-phosphoribosylamino)uracil reductase RibD [Corynebacterium sp. HMSC04H06]OFS23149.1 bifunctional diaminohydroxyphosphoribosylaminopyrimidine deaminase/5-amino-6-(5-phosphoribosylamino)uracil reductase [Corynebacterium sp. HMSC04H06]